MLRNLIIAAVVATLGALALWVATGRDAYTKFQVVETVDVAVDPDDPLAAAGFYDDASATETVVRDVFRFGLLPTPSGLFDRHLASVATVAGLAWALPALVAVRRRWRSRSAVANP